MTAGPNVLRDGPGTMFLWAELSEEIVEPHDYRDDLDDVETIARARLRITGRLPELIVQLATWLLEHGWRGERGRLVRHAYTVRPAAPGAAHPRASALMLT